MRVSYYTYMSDPYIPKIDFISKKYFIFYFGVKYDFF